MNLTKKLNHKLKGTGMMFAGVGGIIINEICGALDNEPMTTLEFNQLPKGYIIKGYGHVIGDDNLINKGRNYINNYRSSMKIKQSIFKK